METSKAHLAEIQVVVRFMRKRFYDYSEIADILVSSGFTKSKYSPDEVEKVAMGGFGYHGVSKSRYRQLIQKLPTKVRL